MKKYIGIYLCTALLCAGMCLQPAVAAARLVPVAEGWSRNTVNTAVFRQSSLVTHGRHQYIAFYDGQQRLILGRRKGSGHRWELHPTGYTGRCDDAHRIISIGVDGAGYIHVAWNHHGNALNYARGIAPGSLELGPMQSMTGQLEGNVTYPEFYTLPDGDLLFVYRDGSSGNGNMVLNRYVLATGTWRQVQPVVLDGEGRRNAYWQMCVDRFGTIHVSWVWRSTPDVASNQDLCYVRSTDGGETWQTSSGVPCVLPVTAATAEYIVRIPQRSELINQTSMTADDAGRPYIATYWRDADSQVPQYRLVCLSDDGWRVVQVSSRTTPFSLSGGGTKKIPVSRPRLAVDSRGHHLRVCYVFRDVERGSRVSIATCRDLGQKADWQVEDVTDFPVDEWEPTFDTELWKKRHRLHLFVQRTRQGDGETLEDLSDQMIYVLEYKL
ncbi:MAG: BNR repeat-containing protein [Bacteroidales bacterium]|nr:BNR repeat-containing protein [Bacteroidales bacterium]